MANAEERSLETVVGEQMYTAWLNMLRALVPGGRTHRLPVVVAGMLQYAVAQVDTEDIEDSEEGLKATGEGSVAHSMLEATETSDPEEIEEEIGDLVRRLFDDAGIKYQRTNRKGASYTMLESIFTEFGNWEEMPWD